MYSTSQPREPGGHCPAISGFSDVGNVTNPLNVPESRQFLRVMIVANIEPLTLSDILVHNSEPFLSWLRLLPSAAVSTLLFAA